MSVEKKLSREIFSENEILVMVEFGDCGEMGTR